MIGDIRKFRFWCQKVIPLVYDNSLSYYEVLCKVVDYLNKVIEDMNEIPSYIDAKIEEALDDEHLEELIEQFIADYKHTISSNDDGENTIATRNWDAGTWLWLNDILYLVTRDITEGTAYIFEGENTNVEPITVESENNKLSTFINSLQTMMFSKAPVNVKDFGAVGDGVTNDTQAFIAASSSDTNATIYVPYGTYLVDDNMKLNCQIMLATGAKIMQSNGKASTLVIPEANEFNVVYGDVLQVEGTLDTPLQGGAILTSKEFINDNTLESFAIVGNITDGENRIVTASDISKVKVGDSIINASITGFDVTTTTACMRVTAKGEGYIDFAPDNGLGGGKGTSPYTWSGGTYSNQTFTIRPRIWQCVSFNGAITGDENNEDGVYWAGNDVVMSKGQRVIGREVDVILLDDNLGEHEGLLVTGNKLANGLTVGVNIQMGGNYNGNYGVSVRQHEIGYYCNALNAFIFSPTFIDNVTHSTVPIAGGIIQEDYGEYLSIRPSIAVKQLASGAVAVAIRRESDDTPNGFFIRCMSADDATMLFGVDVNGNMAANNISGNNITASGNVTAGGNVGGVNVVASGDISGVNVAASGDVTGVNVGATGAVSGASVSATGDINGANIVASTAVATPNLRLMQNEGNVVTPNGSFIVFDNDNNPVYIPCYKP